MLATRSGFKDFLQRVTTTLGDIATILAGSTTQIKRMFSLVGIIAANAFSETLLSGLANMMDRAIRAMSGLPMILVADFIVAADAMQEIFARIALEAGANIEGAVLELGEISKAVEKLAPGVTAPIIRATEEMSRKLNRQAFDAGRDFIRSFIRGAESLGTLLANALSRLAEDFIIGGIEKTLFPATARASTASLGTAASAPSSAVVVNQTVNLNVGFVDGVSGAAWLRANKGAIALAMREAAQDAGGVRRLLG